MENRKNDFKRIESDPIFSRFCDPDCRLSAKEKDSLVFLNESISIKIWKDCISENTHAFLMNKGEKILKQTRKSINTEIHDFAYVRSVLDKFLSPSSFIISFWGPDTGCLCHKDVFLNAWDDFFYPCDENTFILGFPGNLCIFSFDETLFFSRAYSDVRHVA
jgi:hypothetical protein